MEESRSIVDRWNPVEIKGYPSTVTKDDLLRLFGDAGVVLSYSFTPGYTCIIYGTIEEARTAVELFDYKVFQDQILRVRCTLDAVDANRTNTNGHKKVCFADANMEKGEPYLHELFGQIGKVKKIAINDVKRKVFKLDGRKLMLASGVVAFEKEEHAKLALEKLHRVNINSDIMRVEHYFSKRDKEEFEFENLRRTVLVKNYSVDSYMVGETFEEEIGQVSFARIGDLRFASIQGEIPCHKNVFSVTFDKIADAALAVQKMNGHYDGIKSWTVELALTKSEVDEKMKKYQVEQNSHIVVKNLDCLVLDKHLKEMFDPFGEVTSCKVVLNSQDKSIRTGYVKFSYAKDATNAVNNMNGKMITGKRLSVALDASKSLRTAKLKKGGGSHRNVCLPNES